MSDEGTIAGVLKRDRAVTLVGLTLLSVLSWLYLSRMPRHFHGMEMAPMPPQAMAPVATGAGPETGHPTIADSGPTGEDEDIPRLP